MTGQCWAYNADGTICGRPAVTVDTRRGYTAREAHRYQEDAAAEPEQPELVCEDCGAAARRRCAYCGHAYCDRHGDEVLCEYCGEESFYNPKIVQVARRDPAVWGPELDAEIEFRAVGV